MDDYGASLSGIVSVWLLVFDSQWMSRVHGQRCPVFALLFAQCWLEAGHKTEIEEARERWHASGVVLFTTHAQAAIPAHNCDKNSLTVPKVSVLCSGGVSPTMANSIHGLACRSVVPKSSAHDTRKLSVAEQVCPL